MFVERPSGRELTEVGLGERVVLQLCRPLQSVLFHNVRPTSSQTVCGEKAEGANHPQTCALLLPSLTSA